MPLISFPDALISPQNFGALSFPRRGVWQPLYERYVRSFLGPSLLSKDENILQLVVQVLTKIGIRGGDVSEQVSKFMAKAFPEFNILLPSAILISFAFKFCLVAPHQIYSEMIDGFVEMFARARRHLDEANARQLRLMWTRDAKYDPSVYAPLEKVFVIFAGCFDDVLMKPKASEDVKHTSVIAKRVLQVLNSDRPPAIQFDPFTQLQSRLTLLSDDHFISGLVADVGEEAMAELLAFLRGFSVRLLPRGFVLPPYVETAFRKNEKSLTESLLKTLGDWPPEAASHAFVHSLLKTPIKLALDKLGKTSELLDELLPKLWMFGAVSDFPDDVVIVKAEEDSLFYAEGGGRPSSRTMPKKKCAKKVPQSARENLMQYMKKQTIQSSMGGAMGMEMSDEAYDICDIAMAVEGNEALAAIGPIEALEAKSDSGSEGQRRPELSSSGSESDNDEHLDWLD
jgi:hypothetical protein